MLDGLTRMENSSNKLVMEKKLPNGMRLSFFDDSKIMTGDRWLVKLRCQAMMPLTDRDFAALPQGDQELLCYLRERFAGNLTFSSVKERVFVDKKDLPEIIAELLETYEANALDYLASPCFPEKLFATRVEKLTREYQVKKELNLLVEEEDDEGPADFSACFRD